MQLKAIKSHVVWVGELGKQGCSVEEFSMMQVKSDSTAKACPLGPLPANGMSGLERLFACCSIFAGLLIDFEML